MHNEARDFSLKTVFTVLLLNLLVSYSWQVATVANTHVVEQEAGENCRNYGYQLKGHELLGTTLLINFMSSSSA